MSNSASSNSIFLQSPPALEHSMSLPGGGGSMSNNNLPLSVFRGASAASSGNSTPTRQSSAPLPNAMQQQQSNNAGSSSVSRYALSNAPPNLFQQQTPQSQNQQQQSTQNSNFTSGTQAFGLRSQGQTSHQQQQQQQPVPALPRTAPLVPPSFIEEQQQRGPQQSFQQNQSNANSSLRSNAAPVSTPAALSVFKPSMGNNNNAFANSAPNQSLQSVRTPSPQPEPFEMPIPVRKGNLQRRDSLSPAKSRQIMRQDNDSHLAASMQSPVAPVHHAQTRHSGWQLRSILKPPGSDALSAAKSQRLTQQGAMRRNINFYGTHSVIEFQPEWWEDEDELEQQGSNNNTTAPDEAEDHKLSHSDHNQQQPQHSQSNSNQWKNEQSQSQSQSQQTNGMQSSINRFAPQNTNKNQPISNQQSNSHQFGNNNSNSNQSSPPSSHAGFGAANRATGPTTTGAAAATGVAQGFNANAGLKFAAASRPLPQTQFSAPPVSQTSGASDYVNQFRAQEQAQQQQSQQPFSFRGQQANSQSSQNVNPTFNSQQRQQFNSPPHSQHEEQRQQHQQQDFGQGNNNNNWNNSTSNFAPNRAPNSDPQQHQQQQQQHQQQHSQFNQQQDPSPDAQSHRSNAEHQSQSGAASGAGMDDAGWEVSKHAGEWDCACGDSRVDG